MTAASHTAEPALAADGLGVRYGSFVALKDVTLRVHANSVHAIIGPNGAGKTTLFHALTGRVRPASGRITLGGRDITRTRDDDLDVDFYDYYEHVYLLHHHDNAAGRDGHFPVGRAFFPDVRRNDIRLTTPRIRDIITEN